MACLSCSSSNLVLSPSKRVSLPTCPGNQSFTTSPGSHATSLLSARRAPEAPRFVCNVMRTREATMVVAKQGPTVQHPNTSSAAAPASWWDSLPSRQRLTLACAGGLMLSNMDKVNLTLAILPMAHELGWSATTTGLIQSSFFYGFLLMQLPGGALSSKLGGRSVLPTGVAVWSLATFCAPLLAGSIGPFCASRVAMGLGEAVAPSAIVDILAKSVPKEERASAISTAFGGLHVGSIVGLLAVPPIISTLGWPAVFYIFGGAGILWYWMFEGLIAKLEEQEPATVAKLSAPMPCQPSASTQPMARLGSSRKETAAQIPYRAFLRSRPVQVLAATHFAHNWFHYTMLAWLPTYFVSTLAVDLMHAAQTALLPPVAGIFASAAAGTLADRLVARGVSTHVVRKLAQSIAFLGPSALLIGASACPCSPEESAMAVACITLALGLSSFSLAGLYCTHQDLSPKYASALLGVTNVAGSLPGIIGVAAVGALYEATGSWELSLFAPSAVFMVFGAAVYTFAGSHEQIDFDAADNTPFAWESRLRPLQRNWAAMVRAAQGVAQQLRGVAEGHHQESDSTRQAMARTRPSGASRRH